MLYHFLEATGNPDMIQAANNFLKDELPSTQDVEKDIWMLRKLQIMVASAKFTPLGWAVLVGGLIVTATDNAVAIMKGKDWIAATATIVGSSVAWVVTTLTYLTRIARKVADSLRDAFETTQQAELDLEAGLNEADSKEIKDLKVEIHSIEQRVWIREGESVDDLVRGRVEDSNYEKELGVVHQAQADLKRLSDALVNQRSKSVFPRGRARIVLLIDDLDRCPPSKVVQMLEAVHLLVNTKLFVVVLTIDVRFVTLALEKEYSCILRRDGDLSGMDFLEKVCELEGSICIDTYLFSCTELLSLRNMLPPDYSATL